MLGWVGVELVRWFFFFFNVFVPGLSAGACGLVFFLEEEACSFDVCVRFHAGCGVLLGLFGTLETFIIEGKGGVATGSGTRRTTLCVPFELVVPNARPYR